MRSTDESIKEHLLSSLGKSVLSIWTSFQIHTSSHGIPNIHRAQGTFKRSLWVVSMVAALLGLCINIYYLADSYLKYNVTIVMEMKHSKVIDFPAVTICNNNPVMSFYSLFLVDELISEFDKSFSAKFQLTPSFQNSTTDSNANSTSECKSSDNLCCNNTNNNCNSNNTNINNNKDDESAADESLNRTRMNFNYKGHFKPRDIYKMDKRSDYLLTRLILERLARENEKMLPYFGQSFNEMIFDCTYQGRACKAGDFFTFLNNFHGNCYTFNSGREIKKAKHPGSTKGLSIVFNVDQISYIGELSQSAGLRVVIHDPRRMPYPEDEGILVSPGSLTHIGVKMTTLEKLGNPYGECIQLYNRDPPTIFQKFHNVSYTQKDCIYTCLNEEMTERCSCTDIKFPYTSKMEQIPCSSRSNISVTCMNSVWKDYKENNISCTTRCSVPCSEIIYSVEISTQTWPSSKYKQKKLGSLNRSLSLDDNSFGHLVVYSQQLSTKNIFEKPAYEIHTFISDIGGILGLYIGVSLLTMVEYLELIFDILGSVLLETFRAYKSRRVVDVQL